MMKKIVMIALAIAAVASVRVARAEELNGDPMKFLGPDAPKLFQRISASAQTRYYYPSADQELLYGVDFRVNYGQVNAMVSVSDYQRRQIRERGGYLEVRLYAGEDAGHIKRLQERTYRMRGDVSYFTFSSYDVCPISYGTYVRYVKVAVSARDTDGSPLAGFQTDWDAPQNRYWVVCEGSGWREFGLFR